MDAFRTCWRQFLSKKGKGSMVDFLSRGNPWSRSVLSETNTSGRLFHRHSSDLAIGRLSTQDLSYPILNQSRHGFFHCQAEHVSSPGS